MAGVLAGLMVLCGGAGALAYMAGVFDSDDGGGRNGDARNGPDPQQPGDATWQQQAAAIEGIVDYTTTRPDLLDASHVAGPIQYEVLPPPGGPHNDYWQLCMGTVYDAPVATEHAVHSLEHGAVWVTYHPSLPADQVASLAERVEGLDYTFLSPFEGLDAPISLQVWGYQLKVEDAGDPRIDEFIRVLRLNASPEPGAPCDGPNSISTTGTSPTTP